jgi:hypothetical protein
MSDSTMSAIAVLILERPMCQECLALTLQLSAADVSGYLAGIARALHVCSGHGRCTRCRRITVVASLIQPSEDAVWNGQAPHANGRPGS